MFRQSSLLLAISYTVVSSAIGTATSSASVLEEPVESGFAFIRDDVGRRGLGMVTIVAEGAGTRLSFALELSAGSYVIAVTRSVVTCSALSRRDRLIKIGRTEIRSDTREATPLELASALRDLEGHALIIRHVSTDEVLGCGQVVLYSGNPNQSPS